MIRRRRKGSREAAAAGAERAPGAVVGAAAGAGAGETTGVAGGAPSGGAEVPPARLPCAWRRTVLWRSLALQAAWNPQRMQNLGLMVALAPWLRCRAPALPIVRRVCRRHYEYFNTNPYFANFIVGGLLRLEEEDLREGGRQSRTVRNFKTSTARAFASLGDQLFWLGLQPAVLLLASLLAFNGLLWPALAVIVAFAAAQLWLRAWALAEGYRLGLDIVDLLSRPVWHRSIRAAQRLGMILVGALGGVYLERVATTAPAGWRLAAGSVAAGAAFGLLLHKRVPGELVFLLAIPLAVLLTAL